MTALPSDQTTRAVELASAGATRHAEAETFLGVPIDLDAMQDRNAAAMLAVGLPPRHWMALEAELRVLKRAGVDVTPDMVTRLAEARLAGGEKFELRRFCPQEEQEAHDVPLLLVDDVYYMRLGNRVKIGYTSNLTARVETFRPEEVLITEPGGQAVEMQRHRQFAHLRVSSEWFRYESPLTEWVAALVALAAGRPDADA